MNDRNEKGQFIKGVIKNDLTGQRFGRLTVIKPMPKSQRRTYFECLCDCGNTKIVRSDSLTSGMVRSCGCMKKEQDRVNLVKNHSHKMSGTRIYNEWLGMKARCYNKNAEDYDRYGGRGIKVCEEWRDNFQAFYDWAMSNGYSDDLTIDRIDNDGNYEPLNCRWADIHTQNRNRRSNVMVNYKGQRMCLKDAAEASGISYGTLSSRYNRSWPEDQLFKKYVPNSKRDSIIVELNGEKMTLTRAAKILGMSKGTLFRRYRKGLRGDDLFKK